MIHTGTGMDLSRELFIYFDQSAVSIQSIVIQYQQNYLVVNIIAKIIKMTWMYD